VVSTIQLSAKPAPPVKGRPGGPSTGKVRPAVGCSVARASWIGLLTLTPALIWAYWGDLSEVAERWATDPQYSHGYLVVAFALALLWLRRERLAGVVARPTWWGLPLLAAGTLLHLAGGYLYFDWIAGVSLIPALAGLCLTLGGWGVLRWAWPAIAFLVFMLPLPFRIEVGLAYPLQRLATLSSTYLLQTLGFTAVAEGNVILMDDDVRIGVVEACSGLGMLVTFFALATAVAMVLKRRLADKVFIVLSALPIAVLANLIRITVTGVLHATAGSKIADLVFHDLAGWLMMPLALGMLWVELWVLSRLLVEPPAESLGVLDLTGPAV
jgi:exosortase